MSRQVTGPEIIEKRMDYMNTKSLWFYVENINNKLKTNTVENDGRIIVNINYNIDDNIIERLIELYINEGWEEVNVTFTGTTDSLYGSTVFEFVPPDEYIMTIRKKLRHFF